MEPNLLIEYRCACGKLLFRGLLLFSIVEVKCKRCGAVKQFKDNTSFRVPISFVLTIHEDGRIFDACRTAEYVLAYPREALFKMSIGDLCPQLRDQLTLHQEQSIEEVKSSGHLRLPPPYQIKNNIFLLRDGGNLPARSYFVKSDAPPDAYHMVNIVLS